MINWEKLPNCKECIGLGSHHVGPEGSVSAKLLILGQSPGRTEVEEQRPFCGPSGEMLDFLLDELLLDREAVYITNTLKCHPNDNRPGVPEEIKTCKKLWLMPELKLVKPKVILTLGKDAFTALRGSAKGFAHGHVWRMKNRSLVCFYHPAYFLRRRDLDGFLEHAGRLQDELEYWEAQDESKGSLEEKGLPGS